MLTFCIAASLFDLVLVFTSQIGQKTKQKQKFYPLFQSTLNNSQTLLTFGNIKARLRQQPRSIVQTRSLELVGDAQVNWKLVSHANQL